MGAPLNVPPSSPSDLQFSLSGHPQSALQSSWLAWSVLCWLTHPCVPTEPTNQTLPQGSVQQASLDLIIECTSPYPLPCLCTRMGTLCVCARVCARTFMHVCVCVCLCVGHGPPQRMSVHKWIDLLSLLLSPFSQLPVPGM